MEGWQGSCLDLSRQNYSRLWRFWWRHLSLRTLAGIQISMDTSSLDLQRPCLSSVISSVVYQYINCTSQSTSKPIPRLDPIVDQDPRKGLRPPLVLLGRILTASLPPVPGGSLERTGTEKLVMCNHGRRLSVILHFTCKKICLG